MEKGEMLIFFLSAPLFQERGGPFSGGVRSIRNSRAYSGYPSV
jgi:hypothetical protein